MAKTSSAKAGGILLQAFTVTRMATWLLLAVVCVIGFVRPVQAQVAASILVDEASGQMLQGHRPDAPHPPASLAKLMTLYLTFEAIDQGKISLNSQVDVSFRAAAMAPSKLYLRPGQQVTVATLIQATAVKSANDAAAALGEYLANGSEYAFAQRMTAKARELGMNSSTFTNASGLPGGAYTTARDMATLARAIHVRFPKYSHYFSQRYFQYGARTYRNTNRLLHTRGEVDGMKTGFTRASGFNLVASAEYGNQKVILVVLGGRTSAQRYRHAEALLAVASRGLPSRPPASVDVATNKVAVPAKKTEDFAKTEDDDDEDVKPAAAKKPQGFSLISRATASTRTRGTDTGNDHALRYGVQIGSYAKYSLAQDAAKKAYYRVPDAYRSGSTRIAVIAVKYGRKTQYAARLLGFNHSAASQTCRYLARIGMRCHTVTYSVQTAQRASLRNDGGLNVSTSAASKGAQSASRGDKLGYGLQIGTYKRFATARAKANAAHSKMQTADRLRTKVTVVKVNVRGTTLYAARLEGFSVETRADRACNRLESKGYNCDTIEYDI